MERQSGLTLIEMLVSLVLLASVLTLSSEAYRFYIEGAQRDSKGLAQEFDKLRNQQLLSNQFGSAVLYYANYDSVNAPLFVGEQSKVMWISQTSVQSSLTSSLSVLTIQDGKLLYCEQLLADTIIRRVPENPDQVCSVFSVEIAKTEAVKFSYYGWSSVLAQLDGDTSSYAIRGAPEWSSTYLGNQTGSLPLYISVESEVNSELSWYFQLADIDPSRVNYTGANHGS
ncbi:PulJ/GspJ family protein [Rheinheimera maricola]|uniref:Prepilin-type N-terminal cleavage/methylation domain-containing protein n=1 Tax=Rheinheimera maricola TaxID=2793282 RepID=A0ABS7X400_9GAMM|nr:prepilin-type N-terminal cleavage/methylation domain-containing protein [Rheinheimera maricola]MBZ9610286.1 prepilin-type N-terminal cleavage/methylation domain-containing protein [Rheinheimera maricola]